VTEEAHGSFVTYVPDQVDFIAALAVNKLHGGKVTADKLGRLGIRTCSDPREWNKLALVKEWQFRRAPVGAGAW
jgi:DNA polymerase-4